MTINLIPEDGKYGRISIGLHETQDPGDGSTPEKVKTGGIHVSHPVETFGYDGNLADDVKVSLSCESI